MWQAPNQKARNAANKKRNTNRRPLHIKKVRAEIKIIATHAEPVISEARVFLNDLSPKGVGIFASQPLIPGQEIALTFHEPKLIYIRGRVIWCQEFDVDSHVLSSADTFSYRIGVRFVFESQKEQQAIKDYCERVVKDFLFRGEAA